eukprot:TRINITY_DN37415_c0_g1_i2.p1 TRINITY_DN37415_c0_g1~~TRINITY_DN37415_c0_g1_i2.p1  ORF type:complete len:191 (+),score=40.10 TRINITY_DN37415_c0_g1_i2:108-680(+)
MSAGPAWRDVASVVQRMKVCAIQKLLVQECDAAHMSFLVDSFMASEGFKSQVLRSVQGVSAAEAGQALARLVGESVQMAVKAVHLRKTVDAVLSLPLAAESDSVSCAICLGDGEHHHRCCASDDCSDSDSDSDSEDTEDSAAPSPSASADETAAHGAVLLGCGHSFHKQCLISWAQRNATCPLCRENLLR